MSAVSFDCAPITVCLDLPYSTAEPAVRELGLANLTLWLNSEITTQLQALGAVNGPGTRSIVRTIAKSVLSRSHRAISQSELRWLVQEETIVAWEGQSKLAEGKQHEALVVPIEVHSSMVRTPLPAIHPLLRVTGWFESVTRGLQSIVSRFVPGVAPDSSIS